MIKYGIMVGVVVVVIIVWVFALGGSAYLTNFINNTPPQVSTCLSQINSALTIGNTKLAPGVKTIIVSAGQVVFRINKTNETYMSNNRTVKVTNEVIIPSIKSWIQTWLDVASYSFSGSCLTIDGDITYLCNDTNALNFSYQTNYSSGSIIAIGEVIRLSGPVTNEVFPILCGKNGNLLSGSKTYIEEGFPLYVYH